tara:strand:- start:785 stop:1549 length:765 start_codon:yes stop_codon:yes gene_type:complete
MKYIDSHCHINDNQFDEDLDEVILRALDSGVSQLICVGTDLKTSEKAIKISENYSQIFATCGIHPHDTEKTNNKYIQVLEEFSKHEKVVAIGEMGLDYFYDYADKKVQKIVFRDQLELAKDLGLPAVIHNRESDVDLYQILIDSQNFYGVIHCFASNYSFAKKILDLGLHISFTGMVTFVKSLHEVIERIDLNKIMIETDSPYLAPKPFRGKRNEPKNVVHIAEFIAKLKKIEIEEFSNMMQSNTKSFFNLPSI